MVGDSPPSVFVGTVGYPSVSFGPMLPPVRGETSIFDSPERWLRFTSDKILEYRSLLVRGNERAKVGDAADPHGLLERMQAFMLSSGPVASEMLLKKAPIPIITLSEDAPPFGPSGSLLKYDFSPGPSEWRLQKAHSDRDLAGH